jgi:hypothetical protein
MKQHFPVIHPAWMPAFAGMTDYEPVSNEGGG